MEIMKSIQYGISSFADISENNAYYVDKTMYIPEIEKTKFNFLIRPRRFGKSMFLSMLSNYYDITNKDNFDSLFYGTWIQSNPTEEKGKYLVLYLDFSMVIQDTNNIQACFESYCNAELGAFLTKYKEYIPEQTIA